MTKLDLLVKDMMLRHPSIIPTRLSALSHLYLVLGNGVIWNDEGMLEDPFLEDGAEPRTTIDASYVDGRIEDMRKFYERLEKTSRRATGMTISCGAATKSSTNSSRKWKHCARNYSNASAISTPWPAHR